MEKIRIESCDCKTKCIAMNDELILCSKYLARFGNVEVTYCETHKCGTHHLNGQCLLCPEGVEEMRRIGIPEDEIKIYLERLKFVEKFRNKLIDK